MSEKKSFFVALQVAPLISAALECCLSYCRSEKKYATLFADHGIHDTHLSLSDEVFQQKKADQSLFLQGKANQSVSDDVFEQEKGDQTRSEGVSLSESSQKSVAEFSYDVLIARVNDVLKHAIMANCNLASMSLIVTLAVSMLEDGVGDALVEKSLAQLKNPVQLSALLFKMIPTVGGEDSAFF